VRDETIILTSFYAGLRAKEIAALTVGKVFDEKVAFAHSSFYQRHRAKVGRHARCISISAFVRHCWNTVLTYASLARSDPCLRAKKAGTSQPTPFVICSWIFTRQSGSRMPQAIREDALTLPDSPTRALACVCWQSWRGILTYLPRRNT
jgi:hypothetical protein